MANEMLNRITIEGIIIKTWTYQAPGAKQPAQFIRLAHHRPGTRPIRSDYLTVRIPPNQTLQESQLRKGRRVLVAGRLISRDIEESMKRVVERAGHEVPLNTRISRLRIRRPSYEILAEGISFPIHQKPTARRHAKPVIEMT